jgi:small-conductance mechanosensitive channel
MPTEVPAIADLLASPWILGPAVFLVWTGTLLLAWRVLTRVLHRVAARTAWTWDDVLIQSLNAPLGIAAVCSGLLVVGRVLPLTPEWDRAFDVLLQAALSVALVLFADRLSRGTLDRLAARSAALQGARGLIQAGVRGLLIGIGLLIFLDSIGVSITPILASLGVGSLAVALALQDTLANLFAGVYMVADKPIEPGHMVRLETGEEGTIVKIGLRNTWIRTLANSMIIVPNTKLASSTLTNYSLLDPEMAVLVNVGVHYSSDLETVERATLEVARETQRAVPGAVTDFEPQVRFHTFADSSIVLTTVLRAREFAASHAIRSDFVKRLHARYDREGIVIPFPIRTLDLPPDLRARLGGAPGPGGPAGGAAVPAAPPGRSA